MRHAALDDIPALVAMGRKFHEQSKMPFGFNAGATADFLGGMIESDSTVIIMTDNGMIGGGVIPAYCDPDWRIAVEMFWWADGGGVKLLQAFEKWAAAKGAQEVRMTTLAALPRADGLLKRLGYTPTEISYTRII